MKRLKRVLALATVGIIAYKVAKRLNQDDSAYFQEGDWMPPGYDYVALA